MEVVRNSQAARAGNSRHKRIEAKKMLLRLHALVARHRVQGLAAGRPGRSRSTKTWPTSALCRLWRWCISATAPTRFPTWDLAHPFRFLAHNGEINTLRGNVNWMHARESMLKHPKSTVPICGKSARSACPARATRPSSTTCSNCSLLTGRSLPQAMSMLIPEPWSGHESMSDELKAYYEYQACLMEPWDGPASMAFTDGTVDRRDARPQRTCDPAATGS